jgi:hypothetical protein
MGVFVILGLFLILSLCVAAWASILFYLIGKIHQKLLQLILPLVVALVFIAGDLSFNAFLSRTLGGNESFMSGPLMSILFIIPVPFATILAMGAIAPFPLIREHLSLKRPWLAVFAASTVAATYILFRGFVVSFGPHPGAYDIYGNPWFHPLTLFSQFLAAMVIAAAVFGVILFLQYVNRLVAGHRWKRGILTITAASLIILLPAAGIGGLAIFFWLVLQKVPRRINRMGVAVAALFVLALTGTMLSGIPDRGMIADYAVITMVIMSLAVLVPFLYIAPSIGKDWQPVVLLAGAVAADLILSLIATVFDLGECLTSDPLTILTFAEGGIIFAAAAFIAAKYLVMRRDQRLSPAGVGEAP